MNRNSLLLLLGLSLLAFVGMGLNCGDKPPATPGAPVGPASAYQRATASFKVTTTSPGEKDVMYVMDWGEGTVDTSGKKDSGDTATVYHRWDATGTYQVKVMAILADAPEKASDWSGEASIEILANDPPAKPTLTGSAVAVHDVPAWFSATTTDPDEDSIAFKFLWGDGDVGEWSTFVASGAVVRDSHTFTKIETVEVRCFAKDNKGSESDTSDPLTVVVGEAGAVIWWWWSPGEEGEEAPTTAPVLLTHESNELAYTAPGFPNKIYGINVVDGDPEESGSPNFASEENAFTGHPAYCERTGHIIIGNEDGELYAFTTGLSGEWNWPDSSAEGLTMIEWGAPAIYDNRIYVPHDDDTLYYFADNGPSVTLAARYFVAGLGEAAVVDNDGNVYVTTSWGWLYKFPSDLSAPTWTSLLSTTNQELYVPAIGGDGTIYVGGVDSTFYAVDPATGDVKWELPVVGAAHRCVVGYSAIYVTTGFGMLHSLSPAGVENWAVQLSPTWTEIVAGPVLTQPVASIGDGLIYAQDYDDVLYCVKQSNGEPVWTCNCLDFGPTVKKGSGKRDIDLMEASLAITSTGNIIVVGDEALYCVAGYADGILAGSAWPKWQQNKYNTGRMISAW